MCGIFIGRLPEDVASPDAKTREAEEYLPYGENGGEGKEDEGEGGEGGEGGRIEGPRGASANSTCSFFGITRASTFALIKSESDGRARATVNGLYTCRNSPSRRGVCD